ncbi:uncharacterized protein PHACADRAFT_189421 [Phanerochaete carnosa HHB-10118-sp]|uniref:Uncharacterized protein n=1 Tax=Phanerochaete carnosa (strain HHB-10118-sp) TaxID=650164 RepID=K5XBG1_PHACS|nr:uncharacterized protein PHACADRAFT_189421 [Phanerochaete carnosa HHB-10118-sp]EKM60287.1 hypothetical protein PHACADRAFT_189421 [Phanerochaete carnosa HHB-10118-sp]
MRVAIRNGAARLVYGGDGLWRALALSTPLDKASKAALSDWLARIATSAQTRSAGSPTGSMAASFTDSDPQVLVVDDGQFGSDAATYLKHLGDGHFVAKKNTRVSDSWRARYDVFLFERDG